MKNTSFQAWLMAVLQYRSFEVCALECEQGKRKAAKKLGL